MFSDEIVIMHPTLGELRGIRVESHYPRNLTTELGYEIRNIGYFLRTRISFLAP